MFDQQQYSREYYQKNKATIKARSTAYYYANKERCAELKAEYYQTNRERFLGKAAQRYLQGEDLRRFINDYKTRPCVDCNQVFHPVAMDFDHVLGDKSGNIATMVANMVSFGSIWKEILKCEVVCACCHRIRTWNRGHN